MSILINGSVDIGPAPLETDLCLIDAPRGTNGASVRTCSFLEQRAETLDRVNAGKVDDRYMGQRTLASARGAAGCGNTRAPVTRATQEPSCRRCRAVQQRLLAATRWHAGMDAPNACPTWAFNASFNAELSNMRLSVPPSMGGDGHLPRAYHSGRASGAGCCATTLFAGAALGCSTLAGYNPTRARATPPLVRGSSCSVAAVGPSLVGPTRTARHPAVRVRARSDGRHQRDGKHSARVAPSPLPAGVQVALTPQPASTTVRASSAGQAAPLPACACRSARAG